MERPETKRRPWHAVSDFLWIKIFLFAVPVWLHACFVEFTDHILPPRDGSESLAEVQEEFETVDAEGVCGDGVINTGEECEIGQWESAECGRCGNQTRACTADCIWGEWEACSGEHGTCDPGTIVECTTICGTVGTGPCTESCEPPGADSCTPPIEFCNGLDDDCNSIIDNGFDCARGLDTICRSPCGTDGLGTCSDTCELPTESECASLTGDRCQLPEHCGCIPDQDKVCLTSLGIFTFRGGYCSAQCALDSDCGSGSKCVPIPGFGNHCAKSCVLSSECRVDDGYICTRVAGSETFFCFPL